jgi:hypothetical protein
MTDTEHCENDFAWMASKAKLCAGHWRTKANQANSEKTTRQKYLRVAALFEALAIAFADLHKQRITWTKIKRADALLPELAAARSTLRGKP